MILSPLHVDLGVLQALLDGLISVSEEMVVFLRVLEQLQEQDTEIIVVSTQQFVKNAQWAITILVYLGVLLLSCNAVCYCGHVSADSGRAGSVAGSIRTSHVTVGS